MTRTRTLVLHPFLFALYPILLVYTRNADSVYFGETLAALIVVPLATLTVFALARSITGDSVRAALLTSAGLFVVFSFERNVHAAQVRGWGATAGSREWLVLGGEILLLGLWVGFVAWWSRPSRTLNTIANAASVVLLAFLIPGLVGASRPASPAHNSSAGSIASIAGPPGSAPQDPDIYFIVLDAYGRADVLRSLFGYDNSAFLDRMERRGFYLARQSTSNYCQTALSVSATLAGEYHEDRAGSDEKSRLPLRDLLRANPFLDLLKSRSYKLVGFASGFGLTDGFAADQRIAPRFDLPEFSALVLDMTPVWTILGRGAGQASHRRHRERILQLFEHLPDVAADPMPTFCLAHVLAPHPPFVFDQQGRDISRESSAYRLTDGVLWSDLDGHGDAADYAAHYVNQARFIADRVEAVVDRIIARSPEPPVIIIQGDHGPGSHFDPDDQRPNDLRERMSILNLCLIPRGGASRLSPTITPVNTFRVVADHLFGTSRGLLPDRNYYSSYQSPYKVVDVTSAVAGLPETEPARTARATD